MELFGDPKTNQKGLPILKIGEFGKVKGGKRLPKGESYADHCHNDITTAGVIAPFVRFQAGDHSKRISHKVFLF